MRKKGIFILLTGIIFLFSCTLGHDGEGLLQDIVGENLDSLPFDELKQLITASYAQCSMFNAFIHRDVKSKEYAVADERYKEPASLSQAYEDNVFAKGIRVYQSLAYPRSELKIESDVEERLGENISYVINKVYYEDGTSDSIGIQGSSYRADFRKIDSLTLTVRYHTVIQMRGIEMSPDREEIGYRNGYIIIDDLKHNHVEFHLTGNILERYMFSQALSHSDKVLETSSFVAGYLSPRKLKNRNKRNLAFLKKMTEGIEEGKYENKEDLLSALRTEASKVGIEPDSDNYHCSEYYYGNVKSVIMYFAEKRGEKEFTFTFRVNSDIKPYNLIWDKEENRSLIVDKKGNTVLSPSLNGLTQINSYYYQALNYYDDMVLRFRPEEGRVDTLNPYRSANISRLTDEWVCLSYRNKKGILDKGGNEVIPMIYDAIRADEDLGLITASANEEFTLFDKQGNPLFSGKGSLGEYAEGMSVYRDPAGIPIAFIDNFGRRVLSLRGYQEVRAFHEGLSVVKRKDKWGAIRKDGTIAVPFIYDEMRNFSCGVTLVGKDGLYGLMNTDNRFLVPLQQAGGYSVSESNGKRSYNMGGRSYDEHGKPTEKDNG